MTDSKYSIMLFRCDLRLMDNAALFSANDFGEILPVYIHEPSENITHDWSIGGASQWWLHHSLQHLNEQLTSVSQPLAYFKTTPHKAISSILINLCEKNGCTRIFWNRRYEPHHIEHDKALKMELKKHDIEVHSFNNNLLSEPWHQFTKQGTPFKVFTPYWRHCKNRFATDLPVPIPLSKPDFRTPKKTWHIEDGLSLQELELLPSNPDWSKSINVQWQAGEQSAQQKWEEFQESSINHYDEARNIPSISGTSLLSPHLAFGEISTRQIWHDATQLQMHNHTRTDDLNRYLSEIGWREFSYYQLFHFPDLPKNNFNPRFDKFHWDTNNDLLKAWQQGKTGYPLVDAGMRELWQTGYMHNRVRMVVASFLCKDLLIHWQEGAKWFWDTLLDADLASNSASWQWCAGCGADASPFFRIFNPITQSEKFDAAGIYLRKWLPELAKLSNKHIHKPWEAPIEALEQAGIVLGKTYPYPIVDHKLARLEALDRYKDLKTLES